jgi:hypothetical protein
MTRPIVLLAAATLAMTACGRKEETAPPAADTHGTKSSVESLIATPPPAPPAVSPAQPGGTAEAGPPQGNWFSRKTALEKQEIMEGWLYQYQSKDPKAKAAVLEQMELSKLSAADKAQLETLRTRLKYPPIPLK